MRTPLVAANWKMHKTVGEAVAYAHAFRALVAEARDVEIVLAPPFTALHALAGALAGSGIGVAGQDLHAEPQGAFTGEISAGMLQDAGAGYVLIGHSERRHLFGETDAEVGAKVRAAAGARLAPIMCVGETLAERESNRTFEVLDRQLQAGLEGLAAADAGSLVVAYEPVWAIGTGRNATPEQAQEAHAHIRGRLAGVLDESVARTRRILYGGSVKPANVAALAAQPDVDGALVGGAGLDPGSFAEIVAGSRGAAV